MAGNNTIFVVAQGSGKERLNTLHTEGQKLHGSEASVLPNGDIEFVTWRNVPAVMDHLPAGYVEINGASSPDGVIYLHPKQSAAEAVVRGYKSIEHAIRGVDHVLVGQRGHETDQMESVAHRFEELLTFFEPGVAHVPQEEIEAELEKTLVLLEDIGLDPHTVHDQSKRKITEWLTKASAGHDSLGRKNQLIVMEMLHAGLRQTMQRQEKILGTTSKYTLIRDALVYERSTTRFIMATVAGHLGEISQNISQNTPVSSEGSRRAFVTMVRTLSQKLANVRVNPYLASAEGVDELLQTAIKYTQEGNGEELPHLFAWGQGVLDTCLTENMHP